jgi:glycerol kinase
MKKYIMAIDQGTTQTTLILFDKNCEIQAHVSRETKQIFPKPSWVEQSPKEIIDNVIILMKEVLKKAHATFKDIDCIGITNQRETIVLWEKESLRPVYNAIVWQCRRTKDICERLRQDNLDKMIVEKTGLVIDPYFSGTKIKWILDNVDGLKNKVGKGKILAGTIDCFLLYNLTSGKTFATDYTNASRTLLFNINKKIWDNDLLKLFDISLNLLPSVQKSSSIFGYTDPKITDGISIPITGIAGDQQASLFGHGGIDSGDIKCTYGTGSFIIVNIGDKIKFSNKKFLTTICCNKTGDTCYGMEGSNFIAGAVVQWLRDELGIIKCAEETEKIAEKLTSNDGVYFVPAFVGLGTPYWDANAKGAIIGLTRGTGKSHIVRASLESIAYQIKDLICVIEEETANKIKELKIDGGASSNNFLAQFQADILGCNIHRPKIIETTALGVAGLAGITTGFFNNSKEFHSKIKISKTYYPTMKPEKVKELYSGWKKAIESVLFMSR